MRRLGPQQSASSGTAAAPAWSFASFTGTGTFAGPAFLGFAINGAESARLNTTGFGIGTAPFAKLHVYGQGDASAVVSDTGATGNILYIQDANGNGGNGGGVAFGAAQGRFAAIKGFITDGAGNSAGDVVVSLRAATADTATTERLRFTSAGAIQPGGDNTQPFGSSSLRWSKLYAVALNMTGSTAPSSSSDASGAVGDVRVVGTYIYWKTASGWLRTLGSTF